MSLLDDLLRLFGTNRVRMRWQWEVARKRIAQRWGGAKNQARAVAYEHKTCAQCGALADRAEKVCARCGAALQPQWVHRARRLLSMVLPAGAFSAAGMMIGLNVAVFALMVARSGWATLGVPEVETLARFGAWTVGTVRGGEWWRLVTSNFVHVGALHLLMNTIALVQVAPLVEYAYGRQRFVALYLFSGVGGMATSYLYRQWTGENPIVAGASAAIFGLIGAAAVWSFLSGRRDIAGVFVRWAVIALLLSFLIPADNAAHAGGLASGALGAFLLGRGRALGPAASRAWSAVEILLLLGVFASFALAWRAPGLESRRLDAIMDELRSHPGLCESAGDPGCERLREGLEACVAETGLVLGPSIAQADWQRLLSCALGKARPSPSADP